MSKIPLSVPSLNGNELQYVKECIDTEWVSSAGKYVNLFEKKVTEYTGSKYAIACVNGTAAIQVSLRLAGVDAGDEVICPTLTFIASINAIDYCNASPIFMDADSYYNIDAGKTIEFINNETVFKNGCTYNKKTGKKISAILPVHIWGNACWLDELMELCEERNIAVVEDACESLGTFYNDGEFSGKYTGTIGKLGCISFNGNKIITTGGGGMILTDDKDLSVKAKYLTTQAKDDPIRYVHDEIGYNFRLTNIQAALGVAQLEQLPTILKRKKEIYEFYQSAIENIEGLFLSKVPEYADNNHWLNLLQIDSKVYGDNRESLMKRLKEKGIQTRPVWKLNHLQIPYKNYQSYRIENANSLVEDSLCLPSSTNLNEFETNKIMDLLKK
ncbi:MAG: LegC family aminotransferase [Candidatus Marinimicrobia bacterium]|jgi:perosamine synthetase|nr:LegC family aminotransferase [Candidatus Neomarinimicrobiota bacterium]MBT6936972.1 LegC family aminotransferase [Candidatus Neomarinimicrobiota bacterium]